MGLYGYGLVPRFDVSPKRFGGVRTWAFLGSLLRVEQETHTSVRGLETLPMPCDLGVRQVLGRAKDALLAPALPPHEPRKRSWITLQLSGQRMVVPRVGERRVLSCHLTNPAEEVDRKESEVECLEVRVAAIADRSPDCRNDLQQFPFGTQGGLNAIVLIPCNPRQSTVHTISAR
jgi:hypothetical protein